MRTSAERQRLLEKRAEVLARPLVASDQEAHLDVVVVTVAGGRRYAIEVRHVRQVVRGEALTLLPASGSVLVGVVPVQGETVPVADLAAVLGLAAADASRPFVLVLAGEQPPVGLLVDDVLTTTSLTEAEVRSRRTPDETALERGITSDGVVVLDGAALLADRRLTVSAPDAPVPTPSHDPAPATERQP